MFFLWLYTYQSSKYIYIYIYMSSKSHVVKQVWIPTPGGLLVICQSVSIQYILLDSVLLILWFLSVLEVLSGDTFYWFIGGIRRFLYSVSSVIWFGFIFWGCEPTHHYVCHICSTTAWLPIACPVIYIWHNNNMHKHAIFVSLSSPLSN